MRGRRNVLVTTIVAGLLVSSVSVTKLEVGSAGASPAGPHVEAPSADDPAWSLHDEYVSFTRSLPRSTVDRPDEVSGPKVKVIYVVPSFATDRGRDVDGEIAQSLFFANEWLAGQNGGFGVRFDTYGGALDVGYLTIDVTEQEWYDMFLPDPVYHVGLSSLQDRLIAAGWPIVRRDPARVADPAVGQDLYFLVHEAPAGNYFKTGVGQGTCRPVLDALNAGIRIAGVAAAMADGSPCPLSVGRYPFTGTPEEQRTWFGRGAQPFIDHVVQAMRFLPGCGVPVTPHDGEPYVVPGTTTAEIRGGFMRDLLEPNDPLAIRMPEAAAGTVPTLDVHHDTYFHITNGKNAGLACNSDISASPLWSDVPLETSNLHVARRSSRDRPDEVTGMQLHAVYVVAQGATDHQRDTDGSIDAAVRQFDRWLRIESGGTGVRLDTVQGNLDITYLPLPKAAGEYAVGRDCSGPPCPNEQDLLAALQTAGGVEPDKQYVFFYEGDITFPGHPGLCGGSTQGRASFINLADFTDQSCRMPWSSSDPRQWSVGLLAGHELFHALGAVCFAAPDADGTGHTTERFDLMQAGADGPGIRLDPSRNSYWGSVPAGCTDLSVNPLFTTQRNVLDGLGRIAAGGLLNVSSGAPAGATAVLTNLVMTDATADGYITADRCDVLDVGPQTKANGNHPAGAAIGNLSVVPLDAARQFCIYNQQDVNLVADVQGWFAPPAAGGQTLVLIPPTRRLDTRDGGARPAAGSITRVDTGAPAGTTAVLVNLAMTDGESPGYITADRCSALAAGAQTKANGNHVAGAAIGNLSVVQVDPDGAFCIYNLASVHLVVDVQGYLAPAGGELFAPQSPVRLLDTREMPAGRPAAGSITRVATGAPAGTAAVLVNLAMTGGRSPGYITADRCSALVAGPQAKANGNHLVGTPISNLSVVPVDADGSFCIYNMAPVDLVVDLQGSFGPHGTQQLFPSAPSRVLDTRDLQTATSS